MAQLKDTSIYGDCKITGVLTVKELMESLNKAIYYTNWSDYYTDDSTKNVIVTNSPDNKTGAALTIMSTNSRVSPRGWGIVANSIESSMGDGALSFYNNSIRQYLFKVDTNGNIFCGVGATSKVWHQNNDGSGSGLDADTVDGKHASAFLLLTGGTMTGNINMEHCDLIFQSDNRGVRFYGGAKIYKKEGLGLRLVPHVDSLGVVIANAQDEDILTIKNSEFNYKTNKIWHKGNQGHTSGMDADMVDGKHATDFATNDHNHDSIYLKLIGGSLTGSLNIAPNKWWFANGEWGINMRDSDIVGIGALIFKDVTSNGSQEGLFFPKSGKSGESKTLTDFDNVFALDGKLYLNSAWVLTNAMMGHGNGIDSDKLDGLHAESFFRTDRDNPYSLRFRGGNGFGIQFWNSNLYSIYMSESQTGGRAPGETESDYNMYFKMADNGGNRGFVFLNNNIATAGINNQGHLFLKKGITAGDDKFMIDYNEDTESIDFTIN